jgi:DNA-binding NarL/FixJ family response regulator
MSKTIHICLVDDHAIVRQGLKELLGNLGDFSVVAEYDNGNDLLQDFPLQAKPDLYIIDYSMPIIDGRELLKKLLELDSELPVLMLTQHSDEKLIIELYKIGARGYLHKNCSAEELKTAIENIVHTGFYNVEHIIKALNRKIPLTAERDEVLKKITEQELQFISLVCNDAEYTYEQIADIMGRVKRTVDGYRESLFEKFELKSKVGVVFLSFKYKLTEPFL